jgi:hypothetical protein
MLSVKFKYSIHLIDGSVFNTNRYDYYNNNRLIGFTTEDNKRCMCGTKFISKIINNDNKKEEFKMYTIEKIIQKLKEYNISFDIISSTINNTIRVYCYDDNNDFATIRITPHGDVEINGRITSFEEWLYM